MTRRARGLSAAAVLAVGVISLTARAEPPRELRFATILPSGSGWTKELAGLSKRLAQRSHGQLRARLLANAVLGDERDFVTKMDRGELHGAAVTNVGLGLLVPQVRVLELPLLFRNTDEVDMVRASLAVELADGFRRRGYVLLGWGDVGWVRLFTTRRVGSLADLQQLRIWSWTDDPMARAMVKRIGVRAVPLSIQDVLPALQTGLIDACYGSPYSMLALQWHTKIRYVWKENLTYAVGALVVRRNVFDQLSPKLRQILEEESRSLTARFTRRAREDNQAALARLRELHIEEVQFPADAVARFQKIARPLWEELAGRLYPRALLDRVLRLLERRRKGR
jgi:TRAP-type transport system periplasmic protein